jgi:two-component system, cell cycle response regulator
MMEPRSGVDTRAGLSTLLDTLEYHRAFEVEDRLKGAIRAQREALAIGATDLEMRARLVEADMRLRRGRATEAAVLATQVNQWAREHGPVPLLARSHMVLSSIFESVGDSASCLDHAVRAVELLDDDAPARMRGNFLIRLADALSVAGSFDAARQRYREAERIFVTIGDTERQVSVLNNLAYAEYEAGDPQRAWETAQEMRSLAEASDFGLTPPLLDTLARAYIGVGQYKQAAAALETALRVLARQGDVEANTPAGVMLTLAEVQLSQGRIGAAQATLDRARTICVERNLGGVNVELMRVQAEIYAAAGRFEEAYRAHQVFHDEFVRLNSIHREADARTRQALFETAEARHSAKRFWRQARTDALTGLPNRRFVDEEIPRRLEEVAAGGRLAIAIVDADHFKRVNDTLSHEVGDQAIYELGRILQEALPAGPDPVTAGSRLVARLGGEEYLLVLPGLEMPAAASVLRAVRDAVAEHDWSPLLGTLSLTVSVGGTSAQPDDTQATLLYRADQNLYMAKAAGRNRVVVDGTAPGRPKVRGRRATSRPHPAALVARTRATLAVVGDDEPGSLFEPGRAAALGRETGRETAS